MEDLSTDIKKLHESLQLLLKQYKQLLKENEVLKSNINELQKQSAQKDVLIQNAQEKTIAANVANLYTAEEKKALQQKIDFYLKDIEKCFSLLNA